MKAVVVTPSISDFYFTPGRAMALGAIAVEKQLLKKGYETELINLPLLHPRGVKKPIPEYFSHLKPYILKGERGALSFFVNYKLFGPEHLKSAKIIMGKDPDIVFISLFAWAYAKDAVELAAELKKMGATIVIGGPGVAVLPEYFLNTNLFSGVLIGDAENDINNYIQGVETNSNEKEVPEPVAAINLDKKGKQWVSLILSRGCPLMCKFCSNFLTQGRVFRHCSVEDLLQEIINLNIKTDSPVHFNLEDDNLLIRKTYFKNVISLIKSNYPLATFSIDNGLDYTLMDFNLLDFLIDRGFNRFTFSLGSGSEKILQQELRPSNFKKLENILNYLNNKNISVTTFLICGLPEDTTEIITDSLIYMHSLKANCGISMFYPVPGIPGFEDKEIFINKPSNLCCGSSAYPWAESLTTEEMITAFRLARLSNLIKKDNRCETEVKLIKKIFKEKKLYTVFGKNKELIPVKQNNYMVNRFISEILS